MFHQFITANRREIIARTRSKVALRSTPRPTERELESGVPLFLDLLAATLREGPGPARDDALGIGAMATLQGGLQLEWGFTVSQVIHGYGDVCQAVTELAQETDAAITTEELGTLNRCLDDAIAEAVTEYVRLRERAMTEAGTMRSGRLAHEVRSCLSAATVGWEQIERGTVGSGGGVGALVSRNLARIGALLQRSLVEVRLHSGVTYRERVSVAGLIEEVAVAGTLEAAANHLALTVTTVGRDVVVEVDRRLVAGAIASLLENAFQYTRRPGHVWLRAWVTEDRVLIAIEDQCGGLPPGKAEELLGAFQRRGEDPSGLGRGLYISRKGVEASGGLIAVRDLPGRGCIFTIELPRPTAPAGAVS